MEKGKERKRIAPNGPKKEESEKMKEARINLSKSLTLKKSNYLTNLQTKRKKSFSPKTSFEKRRTDAI